MVWTSRSDYRRRLRNMASAFDGFAELSYSQEGEDRILARIFEHQHAGTFVDVGAHHPRRFNNTYLLYRRGWTGLNVDPLPGTKLLFERDRPRDVTVECGVDEVAGDATFFRFLEPALSTFDEDVAKQRRASGHEIAEVHTIAVQPLHEIVAETLARRPVDLLTVDVEGRDVAVLKSAQLSSWKPTVICAESYSPSLYSRTQMDDLLEQHGYVLVGGTGYTRIYRIPESSVGAVT